MTLFLENPLPIWSVGAVCFAISVIVFFAKRSLGSIIAMFGVIAVTLLLIFVEKIVITPSEQVEQALASLMGAIKDNDLPAILATIDPSAKHVRSDAETLMPQVKVKETGSTAVRVEVDETTAPLRATTYFRGRIDGTHARSGVRIFYFDNVEIDWQQTGDQWLIVDYRVKFRGKPIKPVEGFRTIR
jgi:hypothetical protein